MAGIYIHIPFCRQACHYCDFHFTTSPARRDDMVKAILREIEIQKDFFGEDRSIETLYFGGGTPSILPADSIKRITETVSGHFNLSGLKEVTLEANPDDLTASYLQELKSSAVNRFSIGVQSFHDNELKWMNRVHTASQSESSIKRAQDAGFENITIDLIYGVPDQTDKAWSDNLDKVEALRIPHLSAYALTVESGTALDLFIKKRSKAAPDENVQQIHFDILTKWATENGFEHYEISNLAKKGYRAVHNSNYWTGSPYLGIGPSAHSFRGTERFANIANNGLYLKAILEENKVPATFEKLTPANRINESIMTGLRLIDGLDLEQLQKQFGKSASEKVLLQAEGHLERKNLTLQQNRLFLSAESRFFADGIAADLFVDEHESTD